MGIYICESIYWTGVDIVIVSEFGRLTKHEQIPDRIGLWFGSDSGSDGTPDRIGLVSLLLVQNYYSVETIMTQVAPVLPGLEFTISLKIIAKSYFQLNCSEKFSFA